MSDAPHRIVRVSVTPHFQRSYRKLPSTIQHLAAEKDQRFRQDPFDARLNTHHLKGRLKGLWSYSVDHHHRVLFEFLASNEVLYHDIGSHDMYR